MSIDADEGKPVLDKQQELNSIFECSSCEIHANTAQVSITREILPCTCTIRKTGCMPTSSASAIFCLPFNYIEVAMNPSHVPLYVNFNLLFATSCNPFITTPCRI